MKKLFIILAAAALNCGVANAQLDDLLNKAKSAVSNNQLSVLPLLQYLQNSFLTRSRLLEHGFIRSLQ